MSETTPIAVLRGARRIIEDGGDTNPCELGAYCLRCCIGIAKGAEDDRNNVRYDWSAVIQDGGFGPARQADTPLIHAREAIAKYDRGIAHTRQSALEVLDKVIKEM